jgi:peptidoglycan-N-acetylglucosamine deacetylase
MFARSLFAAAIVLLCVPAAAQRQAGQSRPTEMYNMATPAQQRSGSAAATKPAATRAPSRTTAAEKPPTTGPKSISSWPTGRKVVALTYDDGPHPRITPQLLDLLARKRVRATFYVLGPMVEQYPQITKRIAEEGHEVANHSYSHKEYTKLSSSAVEQDLRKTHDLIVSASGAPVTTFRPPYGATNSRVNQQCEEMGYKVVLWDVDTNDWRKRTTQQMVATILKETKDGSIILMHDRYQTTLDTTEAVIDALRERGFEFTTVADMLLADPKAGQTPTPQAAPSSPVAVAPGVPGSR